MIGTRIAHYRIVAELGAGGMGVVYRARDESLRRDVALKLLPADLAPDEPSRRRLVDEARAAAALNHPNICTVHEVDEFEGRAYIAMELVEGRTLGERIAGRALPKESILHYGIQIADALAHAHDRGVVHRDVKPSNVVITNDGRAKVLDFGIARWTEAVAEGATAAPTTSGALVGTLGYMPPEVLSGAKADARSDVWALGCVLYEMATGRAPFGGQPAFAAAAAILNAEPEPLPAGTHAGMRAVIRRCLAKDPERRYPRVGEVRSALEAIREETRGPVAPGTPGSSAGLPTAMASTAAAPAPADQPRRGRGWRVALAVGGPVLGLALLAGVLLRPTFRWGAGGGAAIRSLAVLPLENLSRDPEQEYFADGMTEELITSLANVKGVRVISRTSVMRFKGTNKTIPQIARELNVDAIVEGSALRAGDEVRITAQLIEASSDRHLWARSYQRNVSHVLALQGEVAQAIATEIGAALTQRGRERAGRAPTVNPAAYEEYLRGRHEWGKRTPESRRLAITHIERAIAADSGYAPAWAGLADVHAVISGYVWMPARESYQKALVAVRRALVLDDQLAPAHATLAIVMAQYLHDWAGAELEYQRALTLNPSHATAHQWYGLHLAHTGRLEEGLAELDRARELDPLSTIMALNRGQVLHWLRRYDEATTIVREVAARNPGFSAARSNLGHAYFVRRDFAAALPELWAADSLSGVTFHRDPEIRTAMLGANTTRYWKRMLVLLGQAARERYVVATEFAIAHAAIGDHDRTLQWLEKSFDDRDSQLLFTIRDEVFDPLRSDPRFVALLRRNGLEP